MYTTKSKTVALVIVGAVGALALTILFTRKRRSETKKSGERAPSSGKCLEHEEFQKRGPEHENNENQDDEHTLKELSEHNDDASNLRKTALLTHITDDKETLTGGSKRRSKRPRGDVDWEEVSRVLTACQKVPITVTDEDVEALVELLGKKIPKLHATVLDCLLRVSAFNKYTVLLQATNCGHHLTEQLKDYCLEIQRGSLEDEKIMIALNRVVSNLCSNPVLHSHFEEAVPVLINVVQLETCSETLRLNALSTLTNLCNDTAYHSHYALFIQCLYDLLDTEPDNTRSQCLAILVNLSLNPDIVPHLLAAKPPRSLLDMLELKSPRGIILRTLSLMTNIMNTSPDNALPSTENKAESPETMYNALYGVEKVPHLRNKVFCLSQSTDEDVSSSAIRLYHFITSS